MKRIVDIIHRDRRDRVLWTYVVNLGGYGTRPSLESFKQEALTLAGIDGHDPIEKLDAQVYLEIIK